MSSTLPSVVVVMNPTDEVDACTKACLEANERFVAAKAVLKDLSKLPKDSPIREGHEKSATEELVKAEEELKEAKGRLATAKVAEKEAKLAAKAAEKEAKLAAKAAEEADAVCHIERLISFIPIIVLSYNFFIAY